MLQRSYAQFQTAINYTAATRARRISKNCAFFYCIPGYWNLAAHSGPANCFMSLITPVNASRDAAKTTYVVSDCYQLRSGHTVTRNLKKMRPFLTSPGLLEFGGPQRTRKAFHAPYKTCNGL